MRREAGFTLVEILVITLVIGLLTTVGVVALTGQRDNVNVRGMQVDLDTAAQRLGAFAEQNGLGSRSVSTDPNSAITGGFAGLLDASNQIKLDEVKKIVRGGSFVADDLTRTLPADLPTKSIGITISPDRRLATLRKCMKFFQDKQPLCLMVELNPFSSTGQYVRSYHRGGNAAAVSAVRDGAWGKEPARSLAAAGAIAPWSTPSIGVPGGSAGGVSGT